MARGNKIRSNEKNQSQKYRTHRNKVKRYERLIATFPLNRSIAVWKKRLEHSRQKISGN